MICEKETKYPKKKILKDPLVKDIQKLLNPEVLTFMQINFDRRNSNKTPPLRNLMELIRWYFKGRAGDMLFWHVPCWTLTALVDEL